MKSKNEDRLKERKGQIRTGKGKGKGEKEFVLSDIASIRKLLDIKERATDIGIRYASEYGGSAHDDAGDAIRHAFLSWTVSNKYGTHYAKQLTDAHEISYPNNDGERAMDLKNNEMYISLSFIQEYDIASGESKVIISSEVQSIGFLGIPTRGVCR